MSGEKGGAESVLEGARAEKFAEAKKYAPSWRRQHLKWGEAKAHFARAAVLDLMPSEKAALTQWANGHV